MYTVFRDTTPYWYTPTLGHTSIMVGTVTLIFFAFVAFIFWIGFKVGASDHQGIEGTR